MVQNEINIMGFQTALPSLAEAMRLIEFFKSPDLSFSCST